MQYELTEAIKNNRLRGLSFSKKFNTEPTEVLKSQSALSLDEVKSLYAYLNKQQHKYNPKTRLTGNALNKDTIDFIANGGTSALAFCKSVLRKEGILHREGEDTTDVQEEQISDLPVKLIKSTNDEKRLATFLVLEPQDDDYMTSDLHGDWYDAETVEQSCHNFNRYCRKANLCHVVSTTAYEFVESYIARDDMVVGETPIKKGSWLATIYVDESEVGEKIWQGIKAGYFTGLSIQCMGRSEVIEQE